MGLLMDQVEDVLLQLLGDLLGDKAEAANDKLKAVFNNRMENNSDAHANDLAGHSLKSAVNPTT